jgi:two-component system chemotaxis response regulator CheY
MSYNRDDAILVVDDVATMRHVIRSCLNQLGYFFVDEAGDGEEALGKIRARKYALVLSDWHMQPKGGAELLRQLREELGEKAPPVVFLTMDGDWKVMSSARDLGALRLIVKPLRPSSLKASIENVLTKAAA